MKGSARSALDDISKGKIACSSIPHSSRRISRVRATFGSSFVSVEAQTMLLMLDGTHMESITTSPAQALYLSNREVDQHREKLLLEQPLGLDQS